MVVILAHLVRSWHRRVTTAAEEAEHYRKIDAAVTRDRGRLNIIGSLFWNLVPDAIVLLPEKMHRKRVAARRGPSFAATGEKAQRPRFSVV